MVHLIDRFHYTSLLKLQLTSSFDAGIEIKA